MGEILKRVTVVDTGNANAVHQLNSMIPKSNFLVIQFSLPKSEEKIIKETGKDEKEAYEKAKKKLPRDVKIHAVFVIKQPSQRIKEINSESEEYARLKVKYELKEFEELTEFEIVSSPKKGMFGLGKQDGKFILHISNQTIIEIRYSHLAVIHGFIGDYFMNDIISALKNWAIDEATLHGFQIQDDNHCDDCHLLIRGLSYLQSRHLRCENCFNINLGTTPWDKALVDMESAFGPHVPTRIIEMASNKRSWMKYQD